MKRKTIGLFIDTFFPMIDGVVMVVDNYARRLMKYASVIVFALGSSDIDEELPYRVVRCSSIKLPIVDYSLPIPLLDRKFMKTLKNIHLDIVHIHSPFTMGRVGIDYAKKNNIPVIGTMHSQYKQDFLRASKNERIAQLLTKRIIKQYNRCDECFAVNGEVSRIYYKEYGYKTLPRVMNNATDMLLVDNLTRAFKLINKKYGLSSKEYVFLFVGRINCLKNIFLIVNSLKIVKEKADFKFKMLFVGSGQDENKLRSLIKEKGLEKDIIMCGSITDRNLLTSIYARASLFLFPSLYDASSIVQIEAASQKTPTLFIENAATADTITADVNGFISLNDEESFANKIIDIMHNKKLYQDVCENAYRDIYVHWDKKVLEVYNLYCDLIEKNKLLLSKNKKK